MKKMLLISIFSLSVFAESGIDLMIKGSESKLDLKKVIEIQKSLELSDEFSVQAYGTLRSLNIQRQDIHAFFDTVFAGEFKEAFVKLSSIKSNNIAVKRLLNATKIYLEWKLGLANSFIEDFLTEASSYAFLDSQLGVALDQMITKKSFSKWIVSNGLILTDEQKTKIDTIKNFKSKMNYSLQAYRNSNKGEEALSLIKYLELDDPFRLKIAQSTILQFARENRLADSAKVLKEVVEPSLEKKSSIDDISLYYLTLARLLYQAQAFEASLSYYNLIPDESKYFLTAEVESLWIHMRNANYSDLKGKLASLKLDIFEHHFLPEVYLVNSMASLQLCHFSDVKKSFDEFIRVNNKYAVEIEANIKSGHPLTINKDDFRISMLNRSLKKLEIERDLLIKLSANVDNGMLHDLVETTITKKSFLDRQLVSNIQREWRHRKLILENTIRRMRFVKVEYLSKMRRMNGQISKMNSIDSVKIIHSAVDKSDKIEFPVNEVLFSDELFNMKADLQKKCIEGNL